MSSLKFLNFYPVSVLGSLRSPALVLKPCWKVMGFLLKESRCRCVTSPFFKAEVGGLALAGASFRHL